MPIVNANSLPPINIKIYMAVINNTRSASEPIEINRCKNEIPGFPRPRLSYS